MWCRRKPTILVPHLENNDTKEPSKPVFTGDNTMNMSELDNDDTNDNYEEVVNPCQTSFSREQYDYENEQDDKGENIYGNNI
uniref:Uncharacterized protein n=1 Tax=Arion vulgaris TaxID=1028688 RepID=A0A0B7AV10_9EUPU